MSVNSWLRWVPLNPVDSLQPEKGGGGEKVAVVGEHLVKPAFRRAGEMKDVGGAKERGG